MTIKILLDGSGICYTKKDLSKLGELIKNKAKKDNVEIDIVPETIMVNDYPESFATEMENVCLEYFKGKVSNAK